MAILHLLKDAQMLLLQFQMPKIRISFKDYHLFFASILMRWKQILKIAFFLILKLFLNCFLIQDVILKLQSWCLWIKKCNVYTGKR